MGGHLLYHVTNHLPESFTCYINKLGLLHRLNGVAGQLVVSALLYSVAVL